MNWCVNGLIRNFCIFSYMWQCGETWSDSRFLSLQSVWCSSASAGDNHQVWGQQTQDRPWPKADGLHHTDWPRTHKHTHHWHSRHTTYTKMCTPQPPFFILGVNYVHKYFAHTYLCLWTQTTIMHVSRVSGSFLLSNSSRTDRKKVGLGNRQG